ncbi:tRNA (guanine(6)-N2)-methyltransferase THUMP3-like [Littorina saxatilis]|uniref:tRNA (guanine(6)-N2)-methyltransferase THUMP3-like n=1 Tax=Littorina saxatilis TaxID=31220 RepID=UPI0038B53138
MASNEETCEKPANVCTIEATVPTGFESVAAEEAKEQFHTECRSARGKITFQTPVERVTDILNLGGIDHCRTQVLHKEYFGFTADGDECLSRLQLLVRECNWTEGLNIWSKFYSFAHPVSPQPERVFTDEELIDICYSIHMPGRKQHNEEKKKNNRKDRRKGKKGRGAREQKRGEKNGTLEDAKDGEVEGAAAVNIDGGDTQGQAPTVTSADISENSGPAEQLLEDSMKDGGDSIDVHEADVNDVSPSKYPASSDQEECLQAAGDSAHTLTKDSDLQSPLSSPDKLAVQSPSESESPSKEPGESSVDPKVTGAEAASLSSPEAQKAGAHDRKPKDPTKPAFRVTCKRIGEDHSFDSMSAAATFGSVVQKYFGWNVDMVNFDIEVVLNIDNQDVSVGLALTPESLHKRNLVAFGVTTLRPTICHNMLRMVKVLPGHVVCDPLCGTGSISIQGALRFPAFQVCGDNHRVAMEKCLANKDALNKKRAANGSGGLMMDPMRWDACNLPLRDGVVDVFVSDLPFGKRVGRRTDNRALYMSVLDEMARCGKLAGRASLLTGDINNMMKAIQAQRYWTRRRVYSCNIGGIAAAVFLLFRNPVPYLRRQQISTSQRAAQPDQSQPPPPASDQDGTGPSSPKQDKRDPSNPNLDGASSSQVVPAM